MITPPSWIQQQHLVDTGRPRQMNRTGETRVSLLQLFHFDRCSSFREFLLNVLGFLFRHALFHRFGSAIHQILGFLQSQAGDFAYRLNDVNLVCAHFLEHNREFSLLLDRSRPCRRAAAARYHYGGRRRSRNRYALTNVLSSSALPMYRISVIALCSASSVAVPRSSRLTGNLYLVPSTSTS